MTTATIEWVMDVEGVAVCSECWDDEMRARWPRVLGDGVGLVCEVCERYVGDRPDRLTIKVLREALDDALEYLEVALLPCEQGCECIIHPVRAALGLDPL